MPNFFAAAIYKLVPYLIVNRKEREKEGRKKKGKRREGRKTGRKEGREKGRRKLQKGIRSTMFWVLVLSCLIFFFFFCTRWFTQKENSSFIGILNKKKNSCKGHNALHWQFFLCAVWFLEKLILVLKMIYSSAVFYLVIVQLRVMKFWLFISLYTNYHILREHLSILLISPFQIMIVAPLFLNPYLKKWKIQSIIQMLPIILWINYYKDKASE